MLYLRNTNQLQSLSQLVNRGAAGEPPAPPITGSLIPTGPGLYRTSYTGYFADDPNWFDTATPISGGPDVGVIELGFATGSGNFFSIEWEGYFKPLYTERYTFILESDDASYLWMSGSATASLMTTSSALINNGGVHGIVLVTGSINLTSGSYVPMKIQFGEAGGGEILTMSFYSPSTPTASNFTGYTLYNTSSNGF